MNLSLSVIIPIYNRAHLIAPTLDSVLNQSKTADEIIVVDSYSTDNLKEVLEPYRDKITLIQNEGTGPGASRNTGLKYAKGDLIKYLDSDDVITINHFQCQYDTLVDTNADMVTSPYLHAEWVNQQWKPLDALLQYYSIPNTNKLLTYISQKYFMILPGCMFRRNFIEQVGLWREDMIAYEDWDYLFRISLLKPKIAHNNESLYIYRIHGQQSTGEHSNDYKRDLMKMEAITDALDRYGKHLSYFQKLGFKAIVRLTPLKDKEEWSAITVNSKKSITVFVYTIFLRLKWKIGRLKTKSNWQPEHGICDDKKVINSLLSKLK